MFVKPITYEFLTTSARSLQARLRVVVEDVTGLKPSIRVNNRGFAGRVQPADRTLAPFTYDVVASARLSPPDRLSVDLEVANAFGRTTSAWYSFQGMDRYGQWGYELEGGEPVHYSHLPGGRTSLMPHAGFQAIIEDAPLVCRDGSTPDVLSMPMFVLTIGSRTYHVEASQYLNVEMSVVNMRDFDGQDSPFYVFRPKAATPWFALVDTDRSLTPSANERGFFPAASGDSVAVCLEGILSACEALGVGRSVCAGSTAEYVSGSIDNCRTPTL
jgi:hypothetical protein